MPQIVAIYARSSKDRHDVSCESQVVELTAAAHAKGEVIYQVFEDRALSSTRDELPAFEAMLEEIRQDPPPFTKIYCLDTSRIARDTHHAQSVKYYLRKKRGIELVFLHLPQSGSYMDEIFEKIMEVWDELHSRMSKEKSISGQKQNIRRGYRAGGKAPYGYRLKTEVVAIHRDGHNICKSVNEVDPVTGPIVTQYFERRARGEGRPSIMRDFTKRGLPGPSGTPIWGMSTGRAFEENLDAYLGHLVYNRHQEYLREGGYATGTKHRPREEWVIFPNAHPPLTTPEIAAEIRRRMRSVQRRQGTSERRTDYLLTGLLKCGTCGGRYEGDRGIYRCSTKACRNGGIARAAIERIVASVVEEDFLTPERLEAIIRRHRIRQQRHQQKSQTSLSALERELARVERELAILWERHVDGTFGLDQYRHLNGPLWTKKEQLAAQIVGAKVPIEVDFQVDREVMEKAIKETVQWLGAGDLAKRRAILGKLFTEIRLGPRKTDVRTTSREVWILSDIDGLTRVFVASPTGFEPVFRP